jgi:hypothetical protein
MLMTQGERKYGPTHPIVWDYRAAQAARMLNMKK